MFDVWFGGIDPITLVLAFSVFALLAIQLLLCFKVRSIVVRLLPVIALSILSIYFIIMTAVTGEWSSLGFALLAIFSTFLLLVCGVGWALWAIIRQKKL